MVKKMHGGNEESHGTGNWFSGLFKNTNENEHKSSGLLSGFFQNSHGHSSATGHSENDSHGHSATGHSETGLTFQKIVSYIAAIILAGTLAVIGFMIYNSKSSMKYPPEVAECPDYWESTGPGKCRNTLKVGTCQDTDEMDFNEPKYSGPTGTVEKCKWANGCGLVWDGLKC
jgi:hypothetical protein